MAFEKDLAVANGDICFTCHDILIDDFDNPCECSHPVQCERCGRGGRLLVQSEDWRGCLWSTTRSVGCIIGKQEKQMSEITYFEPGEIALLQHLPSDTPYAIRNVSQTQFSIARHYGGCTYNGQHYTYFPPGDELIRDDVFKLIAKTRRAKKKKPTKKKAAATSSESTGDK